MVDELDKLAVGRESGWSRLELNSHVGTIKVCFRILMRYVVFVAFMVSLGACSRHGPMTELASGSDTQHDQSSPQVGGNHWRALLPSEFHLDEPAHLCSNTIIQTESGASRRVLTIELLKTGREDVEDVITRAFTESGYQVAMPKRGAEEKVGIRYTKSGVPGVWVVFYPDVAETPAHSDAKSMISMSWQFRAASNETK